MASNSGDEDGNISEPREGGELDEDMPDAAADDEADSSVDKLYQASWEQYLEHMRILRADQRKWLNLSEQETEPFPLGTDLPDKQLPELLNVDLADSSDDEAEKPRGYVPRHRQCMTIRPVVLGARWQRKKDRSIRYRTDPDRIYQHEALHRLVKPVQDSEDENEEDPPSEEQLEFDKYAKDFFSATTETFDSAEFLARSIFDLRSKRNRFFGDYFDVEEIRKANLEAAHPESKKKPPIPENQAHNSSYDHALQQILDFLREVFGLYATTYGGGRGWVAFKKKIDDPKERAFREALGIECCTLAASQKPRTAAKAHGTTAFIICDRCKCMPGPEQVNKMTAEEFLNLWRTVTLAEFKCEHQTHPNNRNKKRVVLTVTAFYPHDRECKTDFEDREWTVRQRTMVGSSVLALPLGDSKTYLLGDLDGDSPLNMVLNSGVLDGSTDPVGYSKERNGCSYWPFSNHRVCNLPLTKIKDPDFPGVNEEYLVGSVGSV